MNANFIFKNWAFIQELRAIRVRRSMERASFLGIGGNPLITIYSRVSVILSMLQTRVIL